MSMRVGRWVWAAACVLAGCSRASSAPTPTTGVATTTSSSIQASAPPSASAVSPPKLGPELEGLQEALPRGWTVLIHQGVDTSSADAPRAPTLWSVTLELRKGDPSCVIRFGADKSQSRSEQLQRRFYVYRLQDLPALRASEDRFRELSSHCPLDVEFARTPRYFIASSPCAHTLTDDDPACREADLELESALRRYWGSVR